MVGGGLYPSVPEETMITSELFQNEKIYIVQTAGGITCVELTLSK